MKIGKNSVVAMDYRVLDEADVTLEQMKDEPMVYLHGHRNILPALEEAMDGHEIGDHVRVELPPAKAYGLRQEDRMDRVPIKHLEKPPRRIRAGDLVRVRTQQGPRDAVVVKVGRFNVDLDSNHPYAGKTLTFELDIQAVRPATAEEIAHGHSHGIEGTSGHD